MRHLLIIILLIFSANAYSYPFDKSEWYVALDEKFPPLVGLDAALERGDTRQLFGIMRMYRDNQHIVNWFREMIEKDRSELLIHYSTYIYKLNIKEAGLYWALGVLYGYEDVALCSDETAANAVSVMMMNSRPVIAELNKDVESYIEILRKAKQIAKTKREHTGWICIHGMNRSTNIIAEEKREKQIKLAREKYDLLIEQISTKVAQ